ncbi:MAG: phage/plasmid primase, P4 family [Nitrospiraceae bacterium]
MIAQKLYDAGFMDLVSVMPPDAPLASGSRVDPSQRGKCPGLRGISGWYGYAFTKEKISPREIDDSGANIGLLGDRFPGLDIDVDDPTLALAIHKQAVKFLGSAPVRTSRAPRSLMVYHTDEPFARMALKIQYKGAEHTVEVLGKGRQYVIHGGHPSGVEYGWAGASLWEYVPALTTITKEDVYQFFMHLIASLGTRADCWVVGDGRTAAKTAPPQEELLAPSMDVLDEVVASLPNTSEHFPERDDYVLVGHAIKAAALTLDANDGGLDAWLDWCSRWEDGDNDPEVAIADWSRMHPPFRVGWDYLQQKAAELTAYEPATDIFEADSAAVPPAQVSLDKSITFSDEWALSRILGDLEEQLRYVPATGTWYVWNDHLWTAEGGLRYEIIIRGYLKKLCMWLKSVADAAPKKEAAPYKAAAIRFQNLRGIESVVKLARGRLSVPLADFDKDPWVLNTPGGVVNLRTSEMTSSRKEDLHSRSTAVAPGEGKMPLFSKFMFDLTGGDVDLIKFLQRYMGYCLTGDVSEKVLAFAWGSDSDTGKSTFVRVMSLLFGDYADSVDVEAFITARTGGRIPDDIARLPGARLVTATEPSTGQHWDEKIIKAITGGDEISARKMRQSWFTFKPQFKILVVGNVQPELKNVDSAMLRRVMIVPMNHPVAREDQIEDLADRMVAEEGPQILQWLVRGCLLRASEGLSPPEAVRAQTETYKDTQDIVTQWLNEQCEFAGEARQRGDTDFDTSRRDLYRAWKIWCRGGDHDHGTEKSFKVDMDARANAFGFEIAKVGPRDARKRGYRGVRIKDSINGGFDV